MPRRVEDTLLIMLLAALLLLLLSGDVRVAGRHIKHFKYREVKVGNCDILVPYPPAVGAHANGAVASTTYSYSHILLPKGDTLYGRAVPVLKMLKRQVRNFSAGQHATVTLVFYSTERVYVRWFRLAPKLNMGLAEVPNMMPIEGDRDYRISFISSGDVTATTLTLPDFKARFPRDFETILTSEDGMMQYQIRTVVEEVLSYRLDDIDSPEWLAIPSPRWSFSNKRSLKVHCKVFVPNEDPAWTNELTMYRAILGQPDILDQTTDRLPAKVEFQTVVGIHKETTNYAEENGASIMQGMRIPLRYPHVAYELKLRTQNASSAFEGVYQCALERQWDKLYVTSVITLFGNQSPFPPIPRADLISCERTNFDKKKMTVVFNPDQETCLRCRGIGYPRPTVAIYREERELTPEGSWDVGVTKYINVADAGISEATYIFWRPQPMHGGTYSCRAQNDWGSNFVFFTIDI